MTSLAGRCAGISALSFYFFAWPNMSSCVRFTPFHFVFEFHKRVIRGVLFFCLLFIVWISVLSFLSIVSLLWLAVITMFSRTQNLHTHFLSAEYCHVFDIGPLFVFVQCVINFKQHSPYDWQIHVCMVHFHCFVRVITFLLFVEPGQVGWWKGLQNAKFLGIFFLVL